MAIELSEHFAIFNLYLSTLLWLSISAAALWDSYRMHRETKTIYELAKEYGNGRSVLAEGRLGVSTWFLRGFGACFLLGLLATGSLLVFPTPQVEASLTSFILRYTLIFAIFCFWRAKRRNIAISRSLDVIDAMTRDIPEKKDA